jgi:ribulose-phosphate 3-epimerase
MAADQSNLKKEIELLQSHCAGFHLDIMDGKFVSNRFWNDPDEVSKIVKMIKNQVWIHLMVEKPEIFYEQLELSAGSLVSFHIESNVDIFDFIKTIKEKKHRASLAMRPKTPIEQIVPFLNIVDQVLVMSVEPGFSGQRFLESSFEKITELVKYRQKYGVHFAVGVDGGVNKNNIKPLAELGINDVAIATAIFKADDHANALQKLQGFISV